MLDDECLDRLAHWQYHSGGYTVLDTQLNKFWEFAVTLLPLKMAPNLVTFIGLLIVSGAASLMAYHDPKVRSSVPITRATPA
jgi:hypothetical protein